MLTLVLIVQLNGLRRDLELSTEVYSTAYPSAIQYSTRCGTLRPSRSVSLLGGQGASLTISMYMVHCVGISSPRLFMDSMSASFPNLLGQSLARSRGLMSGSGLTKLARLVTVLPRYLGMD